MTTRLFRLLGVVLVLAALAYPLRAMAQQDRSAHLDWMLKSLPSAPQFEQWQQRTGELPPDFDAFPRNNFLPDPLTFMNGTCRSERLGLVRATRRDQTTAREVAGRYGAAQGDNLQDDCAERDARQRLHHARRGHRLRSTGRQDDDCDRDAHDSAGHRPVPGDDRRRGVVAHPPRLHRVQLLGHGRCTRRDRDRCIPSTTSPRWGRSPSRCRPSSITC